MGTAIAYLVILALLIRRLARSGKKVRGRKGEKKVSSRLRALCRGGKFRAFNDILLRRKSGFTSQIDHVLVGETGVFVIETKNYKGRITGETDEPEWHQTTRRSSNGFENPLLQNKGHIRALTELLGEKYPDLKCHSLIVFPSRHLIDVEDPRVISRQEIRQAIVSHTVKTLSREDVAEISRMIRKANITSRRERRRHIRETRKRMRQR